ncbi:MAG: class I SAM-dependent methyltransferase [Rhodospirillales bacterium]
MTTETGSGRPLYDDTRLAQAYDSLNRSDRDHNFYLDLAGPAPLRVLDMGCGTGQLALAAAARGHRASGADPAAAMLRVARSRPGAEAVDWHLAGAAALDLETRFDLIVMTGHVFQVFLEEAEILAALSCLRRHLAEGGRLAFETRNPAVREWETWRAETTRESLETPDFGLIEAYWDLKSVAGHIVTYETSIAFADGTRVSALDSLRIADRAEVAGWLDAAGYGAVEWYGDWDGSPLAAESPEIIAVARSA